MAVRLFDCFTFFDEFDLLELRLREIGPIVDRFVLVEATKTFQGDDKPLYFRMGQDRFRPWAAKIEHIVIDFPPVVPHIKTKNSSRWGARRALAFDREFYQRDQILRGLAEAGSDDVVMVSDVDEIPKLEALGRVMKDELYRGNLVLLYLRYYRFFLNCRVVPGAESAAGNTDADASVSAREFGSHPSHEEWNGPNLVQRRYLTTPSKLRQAKGEAREFWRRMHLSSLGVRLRNYKYCGIANPPVALHDAGWHFSSLGGYEGWKRKVQAFSHAEYKDSIEYRDEDVFNKWFARHKVVGLEELPAAVWQNPEMWKHLLAEADPDGGAQLLAMCNAPQNA